MYIFLIKQRKNVALASEVFFIFLGAHLHFTEIVNDPKEWQVWAEISLLSKVKLLTCTIETEICSDHLVTIIMQTLLVQQILMPLAFSYNRIMHLIQHNYYTNCQIIRYIVSLDCNCASSYICKFTSLSISEL